MVCGRSYVSFMISAASEVYWLKKLANLKMKEDVPMSNHLNEFNTIFSQLSL